jgi:CheY-like chemotaxis protein
MERRRPRKPPSRPLVLVVDDHDDTRELYVMSLSAFGFEVMALDGVDTFTRVWETHPDIIVTDLVLHEHDGFEFLRNVRRDPRTHDIPVVVVTAYGAPAVRERAERDGCAAFFVKPCLLDELATQLRHLLAPTSPMNTPSAQV